MMSRRGPVAARPPGALFASLAGALLLAPLVARGSGAVQVPLPLEQMAHRASVVLLGKTIGTRDVRVQVPIGETGLPPAGRTSLEFTVRQVGIRVDGVIGGDVRKLVKKGAELWLTDPGGYDLGMEGEVAKAAWVAIEVYIPRRHVEVENPGTRVIAFAETSADRVARGRKASGLPPDAWWQATVRAFEAPARRAEVERLRKAGRGARPDR
jgi:hypothetical protein